MYNYKKYLNVYDASVVLPGSGQKLNIKPLTTNLMKKLLVYENETSAFVGENVLDEIISFSVIDEDFSVDDLYLQDRYFLLIEIRKITKGNLHTYTYTCENCKSQSIQKIDLNNLKVNKIKTDLDYTVKVLNDDVILHLTFLTRKMQKEGFESIDKNLTDTEQQVDMILSALAQSLVSIETPDGIDENIPLKDRMEFLGELPSSDYNNIKDWFEKNDFGIDLNIEVNCPHCNFKKMDKIEMSNFFQ